MGSLKPVIQVSAMVCATAMACLSSVSLTAIRWSSDSGSASIGNVWGRADTHDIVYVSFSVTCIATVREMALKPVYNAKVLRAVQTYDVPQIGFATGSG